MNSSPRSTSSSRAPGKAGAANRRGKIFATSKIGTHQDRIDAFLKGELIYPITLELDLTQRCTRKCPGCPYADARKAGHTLELPFLEKLFSILGGRTPGIVFSGGEPTVVPHFPEAAALAREKGFREIAVITNGSLLDDRRIQDALLKEVTSVRVSMYDWQEKEEAYFTDALGRIRRLRERIAGEGSRLEIGAAMLTRAEWASRIVPVGLQVLASGVDWLYFHPYCVNWNSETPAKADQTGVLEAVEALKRAAPEGANVQVPQERYDTEPVFFRSLYGSHFLIQIGADGVMYAGPECKYLPHYALLDLNREMDEDFLWNPKRLNRLKEINSDNYSVIGTKHRPTMFSAYIESLLGPKGRDARADNEKFLYPEIV